MRVKIQYLAHRLYRLGRRSLRIVGLTKTLRGILSPIAERIIGRLSNNPDQVYMIQGHKIILASGGALPSVGMATDVYEQETTELFRKLIKPGMVVIDIGAHVGYFTLLAAGLVGAKGTVLAFEPEPDNYSILEKNIELNGYRNIVPLRIAASEQMGSAELFLTASESGQHSIYHHGLPERGSVSVETTTIDTVLQKLGCSHVDLVKIDVEGAEIVVLGGMAQLLGRPDKPNLIMEFIPSLLHDADVLPIFLLEYVESLYSNVYFIDEANGLIPISVKDGSTLVDRLLGAKESGNIFCTQDKSSISVPNNQTAMPFDTSET
jgi:FkbM family methyltransferase